MATECTELDKAEKFRRQIIGEVSKKVAQIQNGTFDIFMLMNFLIISYCLNYFLLSTRVFPSTKIVLFDVLTYVIGIFKRERYRV